MPVYKEMFTAVDAENGVWACSTCNIVANACKSCKVLLGGQWIEFFYCSNKSCEHYFWNEEKCSCRACNKD